MCFDVLWTCGELNASPRCCLSLFYVECPLCRSGRAYCCCPITAQAGRFLPVLRWLGSRLGNKVRENPGVYPTRLGQTQTSMLAQSAAYSASMLLIATSTTVSMFVASVGCTVMQAPYYSSTPVVLLTSCRNPAGPCVACYPLPRLMLRRLYHHACDDPPNDSAASGLAPSVR